MQVLRSVILLLALFLVFVLGLSVGVYTSHTNPEFFRQFALFRGVISDEPLEVGECELDDDEVPQLSDVAVVEDVAESVVQLPEASLTPLVDDRMTVTNLNGDRLEVTLLKLTGDTVRIRRERDGREFSLPLDRLIESDRRSIRAWWEARGAGAAESDEIDLDELFKMFDQ